MPSSRLTPRLVARAVLLLAVPAGSVAALAAWLAAPGRLGERPGALVVAVALLLAALVAYVALLARAVGRRVTRALEAVELGTELMATTNPEHRLRVPPGDPLEALTGEINRMADRVREAQEGLRQEVARATAALEVERGKLSAILGTLGEGVVVTTEDGRVTLANGAARALLGLGGASLLGQSLFELVDRDKVEHFAERVRRSGGVERFTLHAAAGGVLEAVMTPLFDRDRRVLGEILILRDVTRQAQSDAERQERLASAALRLRGPLASIRSLSESLLGEGGLDPPAGTRMLEAIHAEAVRLSALVTAMAEPGWVAAATPGHFETVSAGDLAEMALRRLGRDGDGAERVTVEAAEPEGGVPPLLRADASALSGALAGLLRAVLERSEGRRAGLRPARRGGVVLLEASGPGSCPLPLLEACLDRPVGPTVGGEARTAREVVRHHAGEVWAFVEGDRLGFRLTLPPGPDAAPEDGAAGSRVEGAGTRSAARAGGGAGGPGGDERPDFYDFSLFERMQQSLGEPDLRRPLETLTAVAFDTETTGFHVTLGDRVVSLGGVRVRRGEVKRGETFDALVNPGRPIPPESTAVHGITDDMVRDAPAIDAVLPAFLRFADGAVLVGHQVWFDLGFLTHEAARLGLPPPVEGRPALDTLLLSEVVHGPLGRHGLGAVAERLGVTIEGRHSALGDALATAEIYVRLLGLLRKRGIVTLGDALEATRRARDPSLR